MKKSPETADLATDEMKMKGGDLTLIGRARVLTGD